MRQPLLALWIAVLLASAGCRPTAPAPFMPGLGEIMSLTQMRHAKLWFAGEAGNWPLADYELDELKEGLDDAATFHPTHKDAEMPLPALIEKIMNEPIAQVRKAVAAHDQAAFATAFDALTGACNACHRAAKFDFNVVTRPAANAYTNQRFEPAK
jgi:hypothetical protein